MPVDCPAGRINFFIGRRRNPFSLLLLPGLLHFLRPSLPTAAVGADYLVPVALLPSLPSLLPDVPGPRNTGYPRAPLPGCPRSPQFSSARNPYLLLRSPSCPTDRP